MSPKFFVVIFLGLFGAVFLFVGGMFLWFSVDANREIEQQKQLPLLTAPQVADASPGIQAVIEGRIAERNQLFDQSFVAYTRSLYEGEHCTNSFDDDNDEPTCSPIWTDIEQLTPPLWLDVADGRTQLANDDYQMQSPPEMWLSTDSLVEDETIWYQGFKINSPVFALGNIIATANGPALQADFIYGGNRQAFFENREDTAFSFVWGGAIFAGFGLVALVAAVCVAIFWR